MNIVVGPRKLETITPGCKVRDFRVGSVEPMLLIASSENKLESFYLKASNHDGMQSKVLPVNSFGVNQVPCLFAFSGNKNIVHCFQEYLIINNRKELKNKGKINKILIDDAQIALTTSLDTISISSMQKGTQMAQLQSYGSNISEIFWNNSLAITGDDRGAISLWDINKEKLVHKSTLYTSSIDYINSYVDFIHTNFYYSVSKVQRKIAFHDLRDYKPIKITANINATLMNINHSKSGKIFLQSRQTIQVIDVYQSYNILGSFTQLKGHHLDDFLLKHPEGINQHRQLTCSLLWNQFLFAGCTNGCIEVYNTDTFQCLYAYGVSPSHSISELNRINNRILALDAKGLISMMQYA